MKFHCCHPAKTGAFVLLCLALSSTFSIAEADGDWQDVYSTVAMTGMANNGSIYIASATNGLWTSTDLRTWQRVQLPSNAQHGFNDVVYGDGMFVAVGVSSGALATSRDGSKWVVQYAGPADGTLSLNSIAFDGVSSFVAVGHDNHGAVVLTRTSGDTWTYKLIASNGTSSGNTVTYQNTGITWAGNRFLLLGEQQSDIYGFVHRTGDMVYSSADGITWVQDGNDFGSSTYGNTPLDTGLGNDIAHGVVNSSDTYVAGGIDGVSTSGDGLTWTYVPLPSATTDSGWEFWRLAFLNGKFIAVGRNLDCGNPGSASCDQHASVFYSEDGTTWKVRDLAPRGASLRNLSAILPSGSSEFIVGGYAGVFKSSNGGTSWSSLYTASPSYLTQCVVHTTLNGKAEYVAPGTEGALLSDDGKTWRHPTISPEYFYPLSGAGCIAAQDGILVTVPTSQTGLYWSQDGVNWNAGSGLLADSYKGVAINKGVFYGITDSNGVVKVDTSTGGKNWSQASVSGFPATSISIGNQDSDGFTQGAALVSGGGQLFTWGSAAGKTFIASSNDGGEWKVSTGVPTSMIVSKIAATDGRYLAIGSDTDQDTILLTSDDGKSWSKENVPGGLQFVFWQDFLYNGTEWMALGQDRNGRFVWMSSQDGDTWQVATGDSGNFAGHATAVAGLASDGKDFVTVSWYDVLLDESDGTTGSSSGGGSGSGGSASGGSSSGGGGGALGLLALLGLGLTAWRRRRCVDCN